MAGGGGKKQPMSRLWPSVSEKEAYLRKALKIGIKRIQSNTLLSRLRLYSPPLLSQSFHSYSHFDAIDTYCRFDDGMSNLWWVSVILFQLLPSDHTCSHISPNYQFLRGIPLAKRLPSLTLPLPYPWIIGVCV